MIENVDQRVLGAVRLMDPATGRAITRPLRVSAEEVLFQRNRSGFYVILSAPGYRDYVRTLRLEAATPAPAMTLEITVSDPMRHYLPRLTTLDIPRDPNPEPAEGEDDRSLFKPVDVPMLPASCAPTRANWSLVRASVFLPPSGDDEIPAAGALLRVLNEPGGAERSRGVCDKRGEALVIIPDVPITIFSDDDESDDHGTGDGAADETGDGAGDAPADGDDADPVVLSEIPFQLEARYDPAASWPINPETLVESVADNLLSKTETIHLRTGRMVKTKITLETT